MVGGGGVLAEALAINCSVTNLDLGSNLIRGAGFEAIAGALRGNGTLLKLDLSRNLPGDRGAKALVDCLRFNSTLTDLDLSGCGMSGLQAFQEVLAVNSSLKKLSLDGNGGEMEEKVISEVQAHLVARQPKGPQESKEASARIRKDSPASEAVYKLTDSRSLRDFILAANVRLVRAEYAWSLHKNGKLFARRQEAEHEVCEDGRPALVTPEEVIGWGSEGDAMIMAVSHCWETREHPDPCGHQLAHIANCTSLYHAAHGVPIWLFVDYVSLYQYRRTPHQDESFKAAMANMHVFYTHEASYTLRIETLTPETLWEQHLDALIHVYHEPSGCVQPIPLRSLTRNPTKYRLRGWCQAEIEWSSCRSKTFRNQQIDLSCAEGAGAAMLGREALTGKVPMPPQVFRQSMTNLKFTHRSDLEAVLQLQAKVYQEKISGCETAIFEHLAAAEVSVLAKALPDYRCLRSLKLLRFECGEQEAAELAEAIQRSTSLEALELSTSTTQLDFYRGHIREVANPSAMHMTKAVAEMLRSTPALTTLSLGCIKVGEDVDSQLHKPPIQDLADMLRTNSAVTDLVLSSRDISDQEIEAVAKALTINTGVLRLSLPDTIGDVGVKALQEMLAVNSIIEEIWCGDCRSQGMQRINRLLEERKVARVVASAETLSTIDLRRCPVAATDLQVISEKLRSSDTVRDIDLAFCEVGDFGAQVLANALKVNSSVRKLALPNTKIGDVGAKALAEVLAMNSPLLKIDLSGSENRFGDDGTQALAKSLRANSTLTSINLGVCSFSSLQAFHKLLAANSTIMKMYLHDESDGGPESIQVLREIGTILEKRRGDLECLDFQSCWAFQFDEWEDIRDLLRNDHVTHLNLRNTPIHFDWAKDLAEELMELRVTSLDLAGCHLGLDSLKAMATMLASSSAVTYVDLGGNPIGDEGAEVLARAIRCSTSLSTLRLDGCEIGVLGLQALKVAVVHSSLCSITLSQNVGGVDGEQVIQEIESFVEQRQTGSEAPTTGAVKFPEAERLGPRLPDAS
ncbi:NLRC3 [Symbiodinium natans]|uniref:NLRC3 protein n=1 Tax=Symbiodinium natans TaxID=878477 RepID=A0A812MR84_9DINO|nr:NLRC3 [Symbiodinium natans]